MITYLLKKNQKTAVFKFVEFRMQLRAPAQNNYYSLKLLSQFHDSIYMLVDQMSILN